MVSITWQSLGLGLFTAPSTIVSSLNRLKRSIFKPFTPLATFSYATWSNATFLTSWSEPRTCWNLYTLMVSITWESLGLGLFTAPSTIVPSLHRLKRSIFKPFTPLAAFSYATWSSATFLASWSESRTCWNFYTLMVYITWQSVGLGLFIAPSPIVPSLDRLKPSIFKHFKLLASFSYATWSSATFLASWSEPRTCWNLYTLMVSIRRQSLGLGSFTAPSTNVSTLHRLKCSIFKPFTPLAAFSYATWSIATFLESWSESKTCWNFYTLMVSITWQSVGLGLFIAPSPIVPSLHRLKPSIYKLFKLLASFSYAIRSSATFLANCSEPWTYGNFNTQIVSITLQPAGLGLFTAPKKIVPSLHRLKPTICKLFKPLVSVSYATWSGATFLASWSEPRSCWNFSSLMVFYYVTFCRIRIIHSSVTDCTSIAPTET